LGTLLGIASITSVLSVADRALLRPLPYGHSDRLVVISDQLLKLGLTRIPTSVANFLDYQAQTGVFEDVAAFQPDAMTVTAGERVERVTGMAASANLLDVLGSRVARGRWFLPGERGAHLAVVADTFAKSRFGGAADPIGQSVRIEGQSFAIVGILPPGFAFRVSGDAPAIWIPAPMQPGARDATQVEVIGRLKAGHSPAEAAASMHVLAAALKRQYNMGNGPHGEDGGFDIAVTPLREELFGAARPTLFAVAGASAVLLLLAILNTALLWLGRAEVRRREAAVRLALGASRRRVGQQLVVEALLPSVTGGALALLVSAAALRAVRAASLPELAALDRVAVDYRVFGLAMLLSAAAGVLFGIVPLRALFRGGAEAEALAQSRGEVAGRGEGRLRTVLIAAQVGLSCALLAPSMLLVRSLVELERVDPGFRTHGLLTASIRLPARLDPERYARELAGRLHEWRGAAAAVATRMPLQFRSGGDPFSIEGRAYGVSGTVPQFLHAMRVDENFMSLLRIPIVAGRRLEAADFTAGATPVAVINQTMARAFWPHETPLGKRILLGAPRPNARWMTIVGIAADIHTTALQAPPIPQMYGQLQEGPTRGFAVIVAEPVTAADLAGVLRSVDPDVPGYAVQTMEQRVADS
ncbi:MAG TPA: ABC transporter permease, partial [Acetobacteraceae bacterium]